MKITQAAFDEVRTHARGLSHEICGMLVAPKGTRAVTDIKRATNANRKGRATRIRSIPASTGDREGLRRAGLDIVGYYHSHPDHASYASIRDREDAWPGYHYLIVSVMNGSHAG